MKRSKIASIFLAMAVSIGFALPAYAEGGFNSYLQSVKVGFESRTWYDGNTDNVSTSSFDAGCYENAGTYVDHTWQLLRRVFLSPSENRGFRTTTCNMTVYWGVQPSSDYFLKVDDFRWTGPSAYPRLFVDDHRVRW